MKTLLTLMIETGSPDLVSDVERHVRRYDPHGRGTVKIARTNAANRDAMKNLLGGLVLWSNGHKEEVQQPVRAKGWLQKIRDDVVQWAREELEPGFKE